MRPKRLWWSIRTALTRGGRKRADYARKNNIYAHVGRNVSIQSRVIPLYSELISFHDNVAVARNVDFCTHDVMHVVFNRVPTCTIGLFNSAVDLGNHTQSQVTMKEQVWNTSRIFGGGTEPNTSELYKSGTEKCWKYKERIGCIEVMDNVFIGSNSVILYNTKIGPNVVIASGSVVTKDCEPNSVYAGVPARRIGSFDELMMKRKVGEESETTSVTEHNQALTEKEVENAWMVFRRSREE